MPNTRGRRPTAAEWTAIERINKQRRAITEDIWILTEAFYQQAWRVREMIKHRDSLHWTFDVPSIREVRNHLVVHPEKGGVTALNIAYDLPGGPQLKPFGDGRRPESVGLYVHAAEFVDALNRALDRSLTR